MECEANFVSKQVSMDLKYIHILHLNNPNSNYTMSKLFGSFFNIMQDSIKFFCFIKYLKKFHLLIPKNTMLRVRYKNDLENKLFYLRKSWILIFVSINHKCALAIYSNILSI